MSFKWVGQPLGIVRREKRQKIINDSCHYMAESEEERVHIEQANQWIIDIITLRYHHNMEQKIERMIETILSCWETSKKFRKNYKQDGWVR